MSLWGIIDGMAVEIVLRREGHVREGCDVVSTGITGAPARWFGDIGGGMHQTQAAFRRSLVTGWNPVRRTRVIDRGCLWSFYFVSRSSRFACWSIT